MLTLPAIDDPGGRAQRVIIGSRDFGGRQEACELLDGRIAVERHREAIEVVSPLPPKQRLRRRIERGEVVARPEFLVVDTVAAFDLAVLLGATGFDVAVANTCLLDGQREGQREFGTVVALQAAHRERHRAAEFRKEVEARALVQLSIEAEHAEARAIVQGSGLISLLAVDLDDLDVHLDGVAGVGHLEQSKRAWLRRPPASSGQPREPQTHERLLDCRGRQISLVNPTQPDPGPRGAVPQLPTGVLEQAHHVFGDARLSLGRITRDEPCNLLLAPSVTPFPDGLAVQTKPPARRQQAVRNGILDDRQPLLDSKAVPRGDDCLAYLSHETPLSFVPR